MNTQTQEALKEELAKWEARLKLYVRTLEALRSRNVKTN